MIRFYQEFSQFRKFLPRMIFESTIGQLYQSAFMTMRFMVIPHTGANIFLEQIIFLCFL